METHRAFCLADVAQVPRGVGPLPEVVPVDGGLGPVRGGAEQWPLGLGAAPASAGRRADGASANEHPTDQRTRTNGGSTLELNIQWDSRA